MNEFCFLRKKGRKAQSIPLAAVLRQELRTMVLLAEIGFSTATGVLLCLRFIVKTPRESQRNKATKLN